MTITNTEGLSDAEWQKRAEGLAESIYMDQDEVRATTKLTDAWHGVTIANGREILEFARSYELSRRAANSAGGVEVKALEWEEVTSPREDNEPEPTGDWEAASIVGGYYICLFEDHYEVTGFDGEYVQRHCGDLYEAKAAAQADFNQRILSALTPAVEAEPVAWRPMKDAPRGFPIVIKQGQWIATVILNPPSDEGHWTDGDSVIHYNGNVLVSGFHGTYEGWLPVGSTIPHPSSPVSAEVTEEMVETVAMTMHDHRKATDSLWTLWEDMSEDYRQTSLAMVRAGLAALSGGRENG